MVRVMWDQCGKEFVWRYWAVAAVSGSTFDITGEWAMVDLLRDSIFELLCLKSTAPTCNLVML